MVVEEEQIINDIVMFSQQRNSASVCGFLTDIYGYLTTRSSTF